MKERMCQNYLQSKKLASKFVADQLHISAVTFPDHFYNV
jgi:hypothetical protein